jgi:hypothetical protein
MSGADRQRRMRRRRKLGLRVYRLELDEASIDEFLIAAGFMTEADASDPKLADAALESMVRTISGTAEEA